MQILKKISQIFYKGRSLVLLPFFICIISCASDPSRYGRVSPHNTADKNSFSFSVDEDFVAENLNSKPDEKNPKMSKAEAKLLAALLKQKKYCLNKNGSPLFRVTAKQEKVYDMTFAHLIEQNYRARPVAPKMYFGECLIDEKR